MKYWKIINNQKVNTKVAIATSSSGSIGVILKQGQFCVSKSQPTKMLDAQERRGFVTIEKEYDNEFGFDTGVAIDIGFVPEDYAKKKVQEYKEGI